MVIKVKEVPIKAYNSIRKVERYYALLRRVYKIIFLELLRDTPVTPYIRLPVSTNSAIKKTNYEITAIYGNLPFSTIFHHIPLNSTKF